AIIIRSPARRNTPESTCPSAPTDKQCSFRRSGAYFLGNAMHFSRRLSLRLAAGAAALSASSRITQAQAYPSRPVRLIVGLAAGGGQDIVARLIGQWLSERLGRQFIIENRPGASGNLALEAVANAAPDGYVLALLGVNNAINASLYNKLGFEFLRDI